MKILTIIWTCFGWIFRFDDPPKEKGQKPLAQEAAGPPQSGWNVVPCSRPRITGMRMERLSKH